MYSKKQSDCGIIKVVFHYHMLRHIFFLLTTKVTSVRRMEHQIRET